jgi:hypothetical protein
MLPAAPVTTILLGWELEDAIDLAATGYIVLRDWKVLDSISFDRLRFNKINNYSSSCLD